MYAEDPQNNFLPLSGRIKYLREPQTNFDMEALRRARTAVEAGGNAASLVRVDTGIRGGDDVSIFYDPMISKLIVWAPTREQAIADTLGALEHYKVVGLGSNIAFM